MNNSEITPGPWEIWGTPGEKSLDIGPVAGGVAVCQIVTTDGEGRFTEDTANRGAANARAIAALPDLIAALENLQKQLRAHVKMDVKKHFSLMVAEAAAGKALFKAKGEPVEVPA